MLPYCIPNPWQGFSRIPASSPPACSGRIFDMLRKLFEEQKKLIFFSAGIFALVLLTLCVWALFPSKDETPDGPVEPPMTFGYCGAELTELCILSFGRDANGNSIINLFVPDRDFPDFYLNINRLADEIIYVCQRNENTPTSILCMGDVINLGERVEINIMATEKYHLLAQGTFTLTAILLSSQTWDPQISEMGDSASAPVTQPAASRTPTPNATGTAVRITPTATVSYPSYP